MIMNKQVLPSNGYGLTDCEYDELVERIYGFEEYHYYKDENHHDDYMFILNELDKIHRNVPMIENYRNALLGWYIFFKNSKRNLSKNLVFKITDSCQLKCKHCYLQHTERKNCHMSYETFLFLFHKHKELCKKFIHYYAINDNKRYNISGGEPTLNKDLPKMIRFLNKNSYRVMLDTNGIHMPDDVLCALKGHSRNRVQISIDGLEETHDYIRGKGTFQKSIETIKLLRDNDINVHTNMVVHKDNFKEWNELKLFLNSKFPGMYVGNMLYISQNNEILYPLEKDELSHYFNEIFDTKVERNDCKNRSYCYVGNSSVTTEDGGLLFCLKMNNGLPITNLIHESIDVNLYKLKINTIKTRSVPVYCFNCKLVSSCMGGAVCSQLKHINKYNIEDRSCKLLNWKCEMDYE